MKACLLIALLSLLFGFAAVNAPNRDAMVGILEDVPGHYAGQPDVRAVRLVFHKHGNDWQAFSTDCRDSDCLKTLPSEFPGRVTWTITFDEKTLGQLSARTRKVFDFYSDVGLQDIVSPGPVPTVGKKSESFAGFLDSPVYRPLVATSQAFAGDPENWKLGHLPAALTSGVRRAFWRKFPDPTNCRNPDENIAKPWTYSNENITLPRVYSSRDHWFLAQTELKPYRCDGPPNDAFVDQWFVIAPDEEIKFLGKAMWLVDAGDYGNDGKSEVVFSIAGYDTGGYELFYDDFKKHATFEFSYH